MRVIMLLLLLAGCANTTGYFGQNAPYCDAKCQEARR